MADEAKKGEKVEEGEEGKEVVKQEGAPPEVPLNEQQIIGRYKQMRAELQALATKMAELDVDAGEHQYVTSFWHCQCRRLFLTAYSF
jgi:hypothetical protein